MPTATHLLADHLLGDAGPLDKFVAARRPQMPWRKIARELENTTGIDVTYETLRSWFPDPVEGDDLEDADANRDASA